MKNISEVAVGLAYSALLLNDQSLAAEVNHLEDRLDEMRERLEIWVLRSAAERLDPSPLRGLLHLGAAAEEIGDSAQQMVWLVERGEEMHPVLAIALGDSDEVIARVPVAPRSALDGRSLRRAELELETGYYLLAIRRAGRYIYRPRGAVTLQAGDELIAIGPDEGHARLAELGGFRLLEDDDTGEIELGAVGGAPPRPSDRRHRGRAGDGVPDSRDRPHRRRGRRARRARRGQRSPASAPAAPSARSSGRTSSPASTPSSGRCSSSS